MTLERISPTDLVCIEEMAQKRGLPLRCDVVYAQADHPENMFGRLYRPDARIWAHRDLAEILAGAARRSFEERRQILVVKDVLRTVEAQQKMNDSPLVRAHPHWTVGENLLISPPGTGAHPRAMAADVVLIDEKGETVPMGTPFDSFTEDPDDNPAARDYTNLPRECLENRAFLTHIMTDSAQQHGVPLWPLPSEWWDFRFPPDIYERYAPLSDADLPPEMRMTDFRG